VPDLGDVRALSFDCYGTLLDWRRGVREAAAEVRSLVGADFERLEREREHFDAELGRGAYRPYRELLAESLRLARARTRPRSHRGRSARVRGEHAPLAAVRRHRRRARARLATRFRLAIFSNVETAVLRETIAERGWRIDVVVTAEEVGSYKPAAGHFLEGLRRLDLEPRRVLHCSVTRYYDLAPAKRLGLATAWIARQAEEWPAGDAPDLVVRDLAELEQALR
jgi:2-haloalkanoic acid dehalogenase type II